MKRIELNKSHLFSFLVFTVGLIFFYSLKLVLTNSFEGKVPQNYQAVVEILKADGLVESVMVYNNLFDFQLSRNSIILDGNKYFLKNRIYSIKLEGEEKEKLINLINAKGLIVIPIKAEPKKTASRFFMYFIIVLCVAIFIFYLKYYESVKDKYFNNN